MESSRHAPAHPNTVDVLAGLIAELDTATAAGEFYDHVCEALCRLTAMERVALVLYDRGSEAVRPAGSHGVAKELIDEIDATLEEAPIAQRALAEDRVMWATEDLEGELPPRYARFFGMTTVACAPVAAGGRWFGAIFADKGGGPFEPTEEERQTMMMLGRLASLAASVERATRQDERARQLDERVTLVREIHERVMQRLFGLTLALGSGKDLSAEDRQACHDELQAALGDLRSSLARPIASASRPPSSRLSELVRRRAERTPELAVAWEPGLEVPERLEQLAQTMFLEALRNSEKHARPTRIDVVASAGDGAFVLEVINDGSAEPGPGTGLGLRLLTMEALQQDALVEFGPLPEGRWHVRMVGGC